MGKIVILRRTHVLLIRKELYFRLPYYLIITNETYITSRRLVILLLLSDFDSPLNLHQDVRTYTRGKAYRRTLRRNRDRRSHHD